MWQIVAGGLSFGDTEPVFHLIDKVASGRNKPVPADQSVFRFVQANPGEVLSTFIRMRVILLVMLILVAGVAEYGLGLDLPLGELFVVFMLFLIWLLASYWRLFHSWAASQLEVFLNLLIDTALFTLLLFLTGGATNPFVSFYLVAIVFASAALPSLYAWMTVVLCIASYTLLLFVHYPLVSKDGSNTFGLHVFGMWFSFLLSALLCALFIAGIAALARRDREQLAWAREEALRDEKIVALGSLAAGVAHELNTPLSTMGLLVEELRELEPGEPEHVQRLGDLERQLNVCKSRLQTLVKSADSSSLSSSEPVLASRFLEEIFSSWRIVRPEFELKVEYAPEFEDRSIRHDRTLAQAIANLLNNAADASLENDKGEAWVTVETAGDSLIVRIDDLGPGITSQQLKAAGHAIYSTKKDGMGVGILLSNASIERVGGEVVLKTGKGVGTRTEINLPFSRMTPVLEETDSVATTEWKSG